MQYSDLVTTVAGLLVPASLASGGVPVDPDFANELPDAIEYAELRIQRDLDLLQTRVSQMGASLTPGFSLCTISGLPLQVIVVETVQVIAAGAQNPLTRQSLPYMQTMYPVQGVIPIPAPSIPFDYALQDTQTLFVGPVPDAAYHVMVYGTTRFKPLSQTNQTNWLSLNVPDLYTAATMIRMCGWRKDYAAAGSDDPRGAGYWSAEYDKLLNGASVEEARRLAQAASWSDQKLRRESVPQRR